MFSVHDDRAAGGNFSKQRHVSFQSGAVGKKRMSRRDKKFRPLLDDGDIDMNVRVNRNRGHNFR